MADTLDVVTLDEARAALRLGQTDTKLQPQLERLITSASYLLDQNYGPMVRREITETIRSSDRQSSDELFLTRYPVASVTSITIDDTVLDASEYELRLEGGQSFGVIARLSNGVRVSWSNEAEVVFVAGRMTTTTDTSQLAAHCKQGAILQIQHMLRPMQHGVGETNEFDTAAVFANTQGLARGLNEHFHGLRRIGIA